MSTMRLDIKMVQVKKYLELSTMSICDVVRGHVIHRQHLFKDGYQVYLGTYRDAPKLHWMAVRVY